MPDMFAVKNLVSEPADYKSEEEYLNSAITFPICRRYFEFNSLALGAYKRFIELLHPATNHFFRKTSKHNYQQCLGLRGIEVGHLNCAGQHGTISSSTGRLSLKLGLVQIKWIKYLVVFDCVYLLGFTDEKKFKFVAKQKVLRFQGNLQTNVGRLVHPNLEEFYVEHNDLLFVVDKIASGLNELKICTNLKVFALLIGAKISSDKFLRLKTCLERFYQQHKHSLWKCSVKFHRSSKPLDFEIVDNFLCHCADNNRYVKEYDFDTLYFS